jgi:hypothetical protein
VNKLSCFSKYFVICTDCPREEFLRVLADNVEPERYLRFSNYRPYQGEVWTASFRIRRIIHYRNSWLPVITGRVMTCGNETRIHVQMKLAGPINVFFAYASIVFPIVNTIGVVTSVIRQGFGGTLVEILAPVAFVAPMICILAFHIEAAISQRFLCKICLGGKQLA